MVGDIRDSWFLLNLLGTGMGTGGTLPAEGAARGWLSRPMAAARNPAPTSARPRYRRRASHPISVPAASVAGRALRVPSGSACGRPIPRPAPADRGGLWEAQGSVDGGGLSVGVPCGPEAHSHETVVPTGDRMLQSCWALRVKTPVGSRHALQMHAEVPRRRGSGVPVGAEPTHPRVRMAVAASLSTSLLWLSSWLPSSRTTAFVAGDRGVGDVAVAVGAGAAGPSPGRRRPH
jgi:hypothetical protein